MIRASLFHDDAHVAERWRQAEEWKKEYAELRKTMTPLQIRKYLLKQKINKLIGKPE